MAMSAEPRGGRCLIALLLPTLIALTALAILVAAGRSRLLRGWNAGVRETPPTFSSTGPTVRSSWSGCSSRSPARVHVSDILVGEFVRWLEGSWIIQGDALLAVDMSKAEVKDTDERTRTATIILPHPAVLSAMERQPTTGASRCGDIKSRSRIPLAVAWLLGDRRAIEQQAMREAQRLVERAAGTEDNKATARQGVEGMLEEFYRGVGWQVLIQWK